MRRQRRAIVLAGLLTTGSAVLVPGLAWAQQSPTTGQPGTTQGFNCGPGNTAPTEPGNASSAPGSAFNENGGTAGGVYAGNGSGSTNHAGSTAAVSQYDTACRRLSS
jgi:hypothetical protein